MDMSAFTDEEKQFLNSFEKEVRLAEEKQSLELIGECTNKFQFAKTCKVYAEDWKKTRQQMLSKEQGSDGLRKEVVEAMVEIGDTAIEDKLLVLSIVFKNTWHEPISNYIGK